MGPEISPTFQRVDAVVGSIKHLDEGAAVAALGHLLSVPQHITYIITLAMFLSSITDAWHLVNAGLLMAKYSHAECDSNRIHKCAG